MCRPLDYIVIEIMVITHELNKSFEIVYQEEDTDAIQANKAGQDIHIPKEVIKYFQACMCQAKQHSNDDECFLEGALFISQYFLFLSKKNNI